MDFSFSAIFSGLVISSIGGGLFIYGKRAEKYLHLLVGLSMCVYPILISNLLILWPLTVALIALLYIFRASI